MNRGFWVVLSIILVSSAAFWFRQIYRQRLPDMPEVILVGTSADYPPFCFKENGQITGFDIDVAKEVCTRLNKKCELRDMPFELLIPQLQNGSIQLAAAGMTPTRRRLELIPFTTTYLSKDPLVGLSLATHTPPITSPNQLKDLKVIVNQGYNADVFLSKMTISKLVRLPTLNDAVQALRSEQGDIFITSLNTIKPLFDKFGQETFSFFIIEDTNESVALALSPLYAKLGDEAGVIINKMMADGTIDKFKEKWHVQ
ncbi:MAG: Extracellular solute-binding protein family 3 [candidate division TM6 bacterium GW2011_GWF2_43_87]|nr:MAG: Extracellular solute-binding protein family 3 [candidate division TM6 bacterium GW2011_GWF2_43_87]